MASRSFAFNLGEPGGCSSWGAYRLDWRWRAVDLCAFAVELEEVVLLLLGHLQPDEQPGEDDERDDDQRGQRDPEGDGYGLERLHGSVLRAVRGRWVVIWRWVPAAPVRRGRPWPRSGRGDRVPGRREPRCRRG